MKKTSKKIIILIFIISLFVGVIGVTFAYFSAEVIGNDRASAMIVDMAQLRLEYTDTNVIGESNILPGWTKTKTFTVENTGEAAVSYNIKLIEVINTFINEELTYTVTSTNSGGIRSETVVPSSEEYIIRNISIAPEEVQTYSMKITFKETGLDQSSNMGKTFSGKLHMETNEQEAAWYEDCTNNENSIGCKILRDNTNAETLRSSAADTTKTAYAANEYGLFKTEANNTDIYYYRGGDHCENASGVMQNYEDKITCEAVSGNIWKTLNNNIIYNNVCWQIIRTNEDGSIRVIYNGAPSDGVCTASGESTQAGKSRYNTGSRSINGGIYSIMGDTSSAGYTFGSPERSTYTEYRGTKLTGNITIKSTYKVGTGIDLDPDTGFFTLTGVKLVSEQAPNSTYKYTCLTANAMCIYIYEISEDATITASSSDYIINKTYRISANWSRSEMKATANELDSTIKTALETWYTNNLTSIDSNIEDAGYCNDRSLYNNTLGYGSSGYYGSQNRVVNLKSPSYECSNNMRDLYTVSNTNGNGHANKKVGLITADEVAYAGAKIYTTEKKNSYLYTGQNYWTMSPMYFYSTDSVQHILRLLSTGSFSYNYVNGENGVRPVISLTRSLNITSGTGSKTSPYIIG